MRYLLVLLLLLTACARPDPGQAETDPQATDPQSAQALTALAISPARGPLLAAYALHSEIGGQDQPNVTGMVYRPRVDGGADTLTLPGNPSRAMYGLSAWLTLDLNRSARVIVTPVSAVPVWLNGWKRDGRSYWKEFAPARIALGAPAGLEAPYAVSLLEVGGTPSPAPSTPAGQPLPAPNQPCPAWVHEQYIATGPDGKRYPTWHPQIDPVYWCSFGHEHGSKPPPRVRVLYGYTAAQHGMPEPHNGFKTATIRQGDQMWVITQHFGTSGQGRACTRYHTLDVALTVGGFTRADLHFMADFGRGEVVSGQTSQPITGCPIDQSTLPGSGGVRKLNLGQNPGYEPWRADLAGLIGFSSPGLSFDTEDARTGCADVTCTALTVRPGLWGAAHHLTLNRPLSIRADGRASDVFYTDPMGMTLMPPGSPGSVRQFIAPGLDVTGQDVPGASIACSTPDAWAGLMTCGGPLLSPDKVIEHSIQNGN